MRVKVGQPATVPILLTSPADRLTEKTAILNPVVYAGKNGGASAVVSPITWFEPNAIQNPGLYWLTLPAAFNNTVGAVAGTVMKAATNYLIHSSFEVDTNADGQADGWPKSGTTTNPVTHQLIANSPVDGTYAQRMAYTGVTGDAAKTAYIEQPSAVATFAAGEKAVASIHLRGTATGCTVQAILYARNDAMSNMGGEKILNITPTAGNTRYSVEYPNLPAGTTRCQLRLFVLGIDSGDTFDLVMDAAQLQKDALTPYIYTGATIASTNECAPYAFAYHVVANTEADAVASGDAAKASADLANRVAPDNAAITTIAAKLPVTGPVASKADVDAAGEVTKLVRLILTNKTVEDASGVTLFADDGTTVIGRWTWNESTGTRGKLGL